MVCHRVCIPWWFAICSFCFISAPALADDDWGDDDDESGFEEVAAPIETATLRGPFRLKGSLKYRLGAWVERLGTETLSTSKLSSDLQLRGKRGDYRAVLGLRLDLDPVYYPEYRDYDESTRDAYGTRLFGQEMYIAYAPSRFEFVFGRQSVAWGEGDVLSPADVVTPYDQREFGLADIDDVRRPRLLSRLSMSQGLSRFEFIVGHEAYYGERPTPRSEYSPLRESLTDDPALRGILSDKDLDYVSEQSGLAPRYWDYFARWVYNGPGLDFGLSAAKVRDKQGVFTIPSASALQDDRVKIPLSHLPFYHMALTGAAPIERWLVKWEIAANFDEPINVGSINKPVPDIRQGRMDRLIPMFSVAYSGISEHTIGIEAQRPVLVSTLDAPLYPVEMAVVSGRIVGTYLRERLRLVLVATNFGLEKNYGQLVRTEATYELMDAWKASMAYVHYRPPNGTVLGPLSGMGNHDQVLATIRWDFQQ